MLLLTEVDSLAPTSEICKSKVASSHTVSVTNFIKIWFKSYRDGGTNRNDKNTRMYSQCQKEKRLRNTTKTLVLCSQYKVRKSWVPSFTQMPT